MPSILFGAFEKCTVNITGTAKEFESVNKMPVIITMTLRRHVRVFYNFAFDIGVLIDVFQKLKVKFRK